MFFYSPHTCMQETVIVDLSLVTCFSCILKQIKFDWFITCIRKESINISRASNVDLKFRNFTFVFVPDSRGK